MTSQQAFPSEPRNPFGSKEEWSACTGHLPSLFWLCHRIQDPLSEEGGFRSDESRVSLEGGSGPADTTVVLYDGEQVEAKGSRDCVLSSLLVLDMGLSERQGAGQDGLVTTIRGIGAPPHFLLIPIVITLPLAQEQKPFGLYFISLLTIQQVQKRNSIVV